MQGGGHLSLIGFEGDDGTLTYPSKSATAKTMVSSFVAISFGVIDFF